MSRSILLSLALLAACNDNDWGARCGSDDDCKVKCVIPGIGANGDLLYSCSMSCSVDTDCGESGYCHAGLCAQVCSSDEDCPDESVCDHSGDLSSSIPVCTPACLEGELMYGSVCQDGFFVQPE